MQISFSRKINFNIGKFESLQNVTGFSAVVKNINSAKDEVQRENHFYLLRIGQNLQKLRDLKLKAFESGKPPKDIIFGYRNIKYAVEVKNLHMFNRAREVNKPPYRINLDDYFDSNGNLKRELPKKLPKFESKYDYKEIIDTINGAYNQLDKEYVNIIILISKAGWINKADVEDVWDILFVKNRGNKYSLLTALVFHDVTTKNYIFQNPEISPHIGEELELHIEKCKFEDIG